MFFTGRYRMGVDSKGRVSVPAPLRAALTGSDGIYVFPARHLRCLEGAGPDFLENRAKVLDALDPLDERRSALERVFFGEAQWLGFDTAGRITLPEALRAEFELTEEAVFVGVRDRFEIWAPVREAEWAQEARGIAAGVTSLKALTESAK
ncbi:MAG: division/cell wall cluster transcriptional repressor MraZ [Hyphomonadaceae bacterium]